MSLLETPVVLDALDYNNAIFRGMDTEEIQVSGPMAALVGQSVFTAQYPGVVISRDTWTELGCPTLLTLKLETHDDAPEA